MFFYLFSTEEYYTMDINPTTLDCHSIWKAIQKIDLDPIKVKLMNPEDGDALSRDDVENLSELYRRYLFLAVTNPEEAVVPTKGIDRFWHAHILDTAKYRVDCQKAFGFFLDHFPYFGIRGNDDRQNWQHSLLKTSELYRATFGDEYLIGNTAGSLCQGGADCGAACAKCCEKVEGGRMLMQVRPTLPTHGASIPVH